MNATERTDHLQEMISQVGLLMRSGRATEATALAKTAYDFSVAEFGEHHVNTATSLSVLGGCFSNGGDHGEGRQQLEKALDILLGQTEDCALQIAEVQNNLSVVYRHLLLPQKALESAAESLTIRADVLGNKHASTSTTVLNIGFVFSLMGLLDLTLECYQLAYACNPLNNAAVENYKKLLQVLDEDNLFVSAPSLPEKEYQLTVFTVLAICKFFLSKPLPEPFFTITNAQPAHQDSYRNFVYSLKTASIQLFDKPDKPDSSLMDIYRNAQVKLCMNSMLPLHTQSLTLKRIERSKLQALGQATLRYAFPGFGIEGRSLKKQLGIKNIYKSFNDQKIENLGADNVTINYTDKQFRRYAGDNNLSASSYFSVCADVNGDDGQTMCKELFEYTDPEIPGWVWVTDSWDKEFMDALLTKMPAGSAYSKGIYVLLLAPEDEEEKKIFKAFYEPIFKAQGRYDELCIVHIPIEVQQDELTHIVDLRRPETQEWFRKFFGKGDGAVFRKDVSVPPADFADMLPALTYPEYGGSGVTKSVGSWFRLAGVNGLIFPSARADVFVAYDDEQSVTGFGGWNFVDYTKSDFIADRDIHIELDDWYGFKGGRQQAATLEKRKDFWKINGAEKRYQAFRTYFIDLLGHVISK